MLPREMMFFFAKVLNCGLFIPSDRALRRYQSCHTSIRNNTIFYHSTSPYDGNKRICCRYTQTIQCKCHRVFTIFYICQRCCYSRDILSSPVFHKPFRSSEPTSFVHFSRCWASPLASFASSLSLR